MALAAQAIREASGPRGVFLAGNVFDAWKDPLTLMLDASRGYGDVSLLRFGPLRYYLLNSLPAVHHVLQGNARNYVKSRNYAGMKFIVGRGLLTSEGDFWKRQRRLAQPAFHHQRLPAFADVMARMAGEHVARWPKDEVLDVHAEMMRLTLRITGQTLFGADVEDEAREVGGAVDTAIRWAQAYVEQIVRLPPWVPTPQNVRFRRAMATLDRLVFRIVAARREAGAGTGDRDGDLLDMLMAMRDDGTGEGMSDQQLRDEVMTLLLAGHETTANALAFTLHLVSRHPDVAARLYAEVDEALGDRAPGWNDLPRLAYTERVLQESLRLYPPAWGFEREPLADDEIAGFHVPAGSMVAICPYTLHRAEEHWPDPERFDPDRFTPERSEGRPKQAYLPFGDGPRICIGKAFAMMEMKIVLATLARRCQFTPTSDEQPSLEPGITLRPRGGVRLAVTTQG